MNSITWFCLIPFIHIPPVGGLETPEGWVQVGAQISSPPYLISIVSSLLFGRMLGHGGLIFTTQSENT